MGINMDSRVAFIAKTMAKLYGGTDFCEECAPVPYASANGSYVPYKFNPKCEDCWYDILRDLPRLKNILELGIMVTNKVNDNNRGKTK